TLRQALVIREGRVALNLDDALAGIQNHVKDAVLREEGDANVTLPGEYAFPKTPDCLDGRYIKQGMEGEFPNQLIRWVQFRQCPDNLEVLFGVIALYCRQIT